MPAVRRPPALFLLPGGHSVRVSLLSLLAHRALDHLAQLEGVVAISFEPGDFLVEE